MNGRPFVNCGTNASSRLTPFQRATGLPIVMASWALVLLSWKLRFVALAIRCGFPKPFERLQASQEIHRVRELVGTTDGAGLRVSGGGGTTLEGAFVSGVA